MAVSLIEKIALKPCPFCGGEPSLLADVTHSTAWEIECPGVSCSVRPSVWEEDKQSAIAAWNNRAALTAIMGEGDGVQEVDREAAAAYWKVCGIGTEETQRIYLAGDADDAQITQAFARHRSTAAAAERARIVAWLRATCYGDPSEAKEFADMIEEGETE